jgi:serine/threonine protein kinase
MLLGRAPFAARDLDVLASMHLRAELPSPGGPGGPDDSGAAPAAQDVLWRALAKGRRARYPTVAAFREAVAGVRRAPEAAPAPGAAPEPAAPAGAPEGEVGAAEVGPYRAGEALGASASAPAFAVAFRATDRRTQSPAVVHRLVLPAGTEPALLRAVDEGLHGAQESDDCPRLARLLGWDVVDGAGAAAAQPYLAREYVDGRSVRALLRSQRRVQPGHALEIGEQVAEALAYLARSGRVHGAVRPENVIVAPDGGVKLTDWAVSYVRRAVLAGGQAEGTAGSPSVYRSPEEYWGQEPDSRSDLFCLGLLLYELIAGAPPFPPPPSAAPEALAGIFRERLGKDRAALPGVPEAVERIVFKALAVDPLDRYPEPQAMLADIEHYLRPAARRAALHSPSGATFPIERSQIVLGRLHPGSMPYPDVNLAGEPGGDTVSRQHARLYFQDGGWWIVQQQDVVNWTYVQGRLLHTGEPAPLRDGDRLDVGQVTLTFRTGAARRDDRPR